LISSFNLAKQQKKLIEIVERKYGRYTRDIRYLDLVIIQNKTLL